MEKIGKAIGLCILLYILVMGLSWINANHPVSVSPPSYSQEK